MRRLRVLIADDHALLAEGMASLIQPHHDVVGISPNGRQMVTDVERLRPDLVTLDIGMPGLNGLEAARQVRKLYPRVLLIFVTQQVDLPHLKAALEAGGLGFVAKQSASSELLGALQEVFAGRRYVTPLLEDALSTVALPVQGREAPPAGPLTGRQREVLQLIAEGHTNRSMAEALKISLKTVEFHKEAIMRVLGLRTTAELTRYAVAQGIA